MMTETGDWMYNALDQIVLGASPPDWSKDGWVFTPIDMDLLPAEEKRKQEKPRDGQQSDASLLASTSNVTLDTTAMRARLQCERVAIQDDTWFTDELASMIEERGSQIKNMSASTLNITGNLLPRTLFANTSFDTTVLSGPYRVLCCANETEEANSAVAYWSLANEYKWWTRSGRQWTGNVPAGDDWPSHFVIKNIVGPAYTTAVKVYTNNMPSIYNPIQFKEVPSIQALDCKPVIEQAEARVMVARSSAQVLDFKLLEEPRPRSDVWKLEFDDIEGPSSSESLGENYTATIG